MIAAGRLTIVVKLAASSCPGSSAWKYDGKAERVAISPEHAAPA